jgi:hypothetical protein
MRALFAGILGSICAAIFAQGGMGPGPGVKSYAGGGGGDTPPTFGCAATTVADNSNTLNATAPSCAAAGYVLLAIFTQDGSGATLTFPSGWTKVRTDSVMHGDNQTFAWGWKIATGSDSYTFTGSTGNNIGVSIAAYSGASSTPVEISSANNPDGASPPTGNITVTGLSITTSNKDVIVWLGGVDTDGWDGDWTAPSGMTLRTSASNGNSFEAIAIADFTQSSAGATGDQSGTWNGGGSSGNPVAYLVALTGP